MVLLYVGERINRIQFEEHDYYTRFVKSVQSFALSINIQETGAGKRAENY